MFENLVLLVVTNSPLFTLATIPRANYLQIHCPLFGLLGGLESHFINLHFWQHYTSKCEDITISFNIVPRAMSV